MNGQEKEQYYNYRMLSKEIDEEYGALADVYGVSDGFFWIMYVLRSRDGETSTQTDVAKELSMNKQTVSSAIKKMEAEGYITLETTADNRKNKIIRLTKKGVDFAEQSVDNVFDCEIQAFDKLTQREKEQFLRLSSKYAKNLKALFKNLRGK